MKMKRKMERIQKKLLKSKLPKLICDFECKYMLSLQENFYIRFDFLKISY